MNREHDKKTIDFYSTSEVAEDYEKIRFHSRAGRCRDHLQKKLILSHVDKSSLKEKTILDVGCGTGRFSRFFAELGAKVIGIDASTAMLREARKQGKRVTYLSGNVCQLPFHDNSFDLMVSVNVLNHLANYRMAIGEMCRVSRKVILGIPNKHSLLLLAYIYRFLRGYNTKYSGYTVKKYENSPIPYSIYFSMSEIRSILQQNGFSNMRFRGCWVIHMPNIATGFFQWLDNCLSSTPLERFGSFMTISAEKNSLFKNGEVKKVGGSGRDINGTYKKEKFS